MMKGRVCFNHDVKWAECGKNNFSSPHHIVILGSEL